jgi:hypothetical protein
MLNDAVDFLGSSLSACASGPGAIWWALNRPRHNSPCASKEAERTLNTLRAFQSCRRTPSTT